jgi:hypothetical protein
MDHSSKLIAALVLSFAGTAHAGYALARPPSGWSPGNYAPSANDSVYGRVIHSPNGPTTTVGGQAVKMPASYRLAANAPRIAAGIIFAHPYVRAGAAIASWLGVAGLVWDAVNRQWVKPDLSYPQSDGQMWAFGNTSITGWHRTKEGACNSLISYFQSIDPSANFTGYVDGEFCVRVASGALDRYRLTSREQGACPVGWYVTPAGCVQTPPPKTLTKEQFEDALAPKPMPERVPLELPQPTPLPIEHQPFINPLPGPDPQHLPRFVPSGDPVPNPNYDPNAAPGPNNQPYTQPGTRVVPSPTPSQPWRLDHQPVNRPQANGMPKPNPDAEPGTDPTDKPKPEEQQSLCEKYPDIVACAKLGEPGEATPVPDETKTLTIDPENGFGPSDASCPPPRTVEVAGLTLSMPFDLLCDFATGLKPVIVGLAWLTAAFTFMGIGRRS